jgi:hypothetical protein
LESFINRFINLKLFVMKDNRNDRDDLRNSDDDQLRPNTMNEAIREASGDPDADLSDLQDTTSSDMEGEGRRISGTSDVDQTQGVGYTPNDASGVRSGGITDMDDQTAGGAGLNTGARQGLGSHLNTKKGVSGSDYDGQNATS